MAFSTAEIIAIGDELVSGQRLDTNSQWISEQLGDFGIEPAFHTCVGDDFANLTSAFEIAVARADVVIATGGIGPTKDDLTRQVLAEVAKAKLIFDEQIESRIRSIFESAGRAMPENNRVQAYFPEGSKIISNAEGTAPGIDMVIGSARVFALPGVPYEMKQMWRDHVSPAVSGGTRKQTLVHHVIHCFGAGESQVEQMLEGMTDRNREPRVGITASQATISLRISARGADETDCLEQLRSSKQEIYHRLGALVFGENGIELQEVVIDELKQRNQTIAISDFGFGGAAGLALMQVDARGRWVKGSHATGDKKLELELPSAAHAIRDQQQTDWGVAISPLKKVSDARMFEIAMANANGTQIASHRYGGHSGLRKTRTTKQILNQIRLFLQEQAS